jgi:hypothetical protein
VPALSWEDLSQFLDTDEFAVEAVINLQAGGSVTVSVIFDDPFLDAQLGEYEFETARPRMMAREADFAAVSRGDEVSIDGVSYVTLSGPRPDGTGMASVELVEQGAGGAAF